MVRSANNPVLEQQRPHGPKQISWWNRSLSNERLRRRYRTARRRGDEAEVRGRLYYVCRSKSSRTDISCIKVGDILHKNWQSCMEALLNNFIPQHTMNIATFGLDPNPQDVTVGEVESKLILKNFMILLTLREKVQFFRQPCLILVLHLLMIKKYLTYLLHFLKQHTLPNF